MGPEPSSPKASSRFSETGATWIPFSLTPEQLLAYGSALAAVRVPAGPPVDPLELLAGAVAADSFWASLPPAVLVARPGETPLLAALVLGDDVPRESLLSRARDLPFAASTLRYISLRQLHADVDLLARRLRQRLGGELSRARFAAVPRGGYRVLEQLASALALPSAQLATPPFADGDLLILVDDCCLTGAALRRFLDAGAAEAVLFAPLYSHPDLRAAIESAEPRVEACLGVRDLAATPIASLEEDEAWRRRWRDRLGGRYWVGRLEHVCFPWTEPDRVVWDAAAGEPARSFRVVPPELCSKNRPPAGTSAIPVQMAPPARGPLAPAPDVVFARLPGTEEPVVALMALDRGAGLRLEGPAADLWLAVLERGTVEAALERVAERWQVDHRRLEEDLRPVAEALLQRGFLTQASSP